MIERSEIKSKINGKVVYRDLFAVHFYLRNCKNIVQEKTQNVFICYKKQTNTDIKEKTRKNIRVNIVFYGKVVTLQPKNKGWVTMPTHIALIFNA